MNLSVKNIFLPVYPENGVTFCLASISPHLAGDPNRSRQGRPALGHFCLPIERHSQLGNGYKIISAGEK
jgi:hypothetical protein